MTTSKKVILTAINFKGIAQVKKETKQLAENLLCSESHIKNIIRQVENDSIILKSRVIEKLISNGNNKNDVSKMVESHFDYAAKYYNTVKSISECIRSIY